MHQSTKLIIKERRFFDFVPGNSLSLLKCCALILDGNNGNGDDVKVEGNVMVMWLLGNFGRYGIQPFHILFKMGNNNKDKDNNNTEEVDGMPKTCCVAYHTLTGGHFDRELRFLVEETTKDDSGAAVMSMTIAIPNGNRALPVCLAKAMVLPFAHSIVQLFQIQMEQPLARRRQSSLLGWWTQFGSTYNMQSCTSPHCVRALVGKV
jgi:hypothetical protein